MKAARLERVVLFGLPVIVLLVSFIGVCAIAGTPWPWDDVVHEDGIRTLLGTILYFEHATRELVPDLILALAVAGAVRYFFPPNLAVANADAQSWRWYLWMWSAAILIVILVGTALTVGDRAIVDNLAQLHTREGASLVWGAHWRYHLVERFATILLAFAASGAIWLFRGRPEAVSVSGRHTLYSASLAAFAGLTLLFHPTSEPFREPTFLGHQIRELFTHALVTLPLALGVCFELARRFSSGAGMRSGRRVWPIALTGTLGVMSGVFLLAASVLTKAQSHGQTSGLARLLLPHFFEHSLGYALVPALAGALYLWSPSPSAP